MRVDRRTGIRRPAISTVLGTMIFLIVALAVFATFEAVIHSSLNAIQSNQTVGAQQDQRAKESLVVSTPTSPTDLTVQNNGQVTSLIVSVFGISNNGTIYTVSVCPAVSVPPQQQVTVNTTQAAKPCGGMIDSLPCNINCNETGVITSLGNVFFANTQVTLADSVGGSLVYAPTDFKFYSAEGGFGYNEYGRCGTGGFGHAETTNTAPLGDGYPLSGYSIYVPSGSGSSAFLGGIPGCHGVIFSLPFKNLDPQHRAITLSQYSSISISSPGASGSEVWYIVGSATGDPTCDPAYTCGTGYASYPDSPPTAPPVTIAYDQTATLYFAASSTCITGSGADPCGTPSDAPSSVGTVTVQLVGNYTGGDLFAGSIDAGLTYFSSAQANPQSDCGTNGKTLCPLSGPPGTYITLSACVASVNSSDYNNEHCFAAQPDVLWFNKNGTISTLRNLSPNTCGATPENCITFQIPLKTPPCSFNDQGACYQIAVTDKVVNYVDGAVQVTTPKLGLNPQSGPAGTVVEVNGTQWGPGSTVTLTTPLASTFIATPTCTSSGVCTPSANGAFTASFEVGSSFHVGHLYPVNATDTFGNKASAVFKITLATVSITPSQGPAGSLVTLSGEGYVAGTAYSYCLSATDTNSSTCITTQYSGTMGSYGTFTASSTGTIPTSVTLTVPLKTAPATYYVLTCTRTPACGTSGNTILADASFLVTAPTLQTSPASGPVGTPVDLSGTGYAPSTTYDTCMSTSASSTASCISASASSFLSTPSGDIPSTATVTAPVSPYGSYYILVYQSGSTAVIDTSTFLITPSITLTNSNGVTITGGVVGSSVTVTGTGFTASLPASSVAITFSGDSSALTHCGTTSTGSISTGCTFTVPTLSAGAHTVTATYSTEAPTTTFTIEPSISLTPIKGVPGTSVAVAGTGFAATEYGTTVTVAIQFGTTPTSGTTLKTSPTSCDTSSTGTFSCTFDVPYQPGTSYYVNATDSDKNSADAPFTLEAIITLSPTTGQDSSVVTVTGYGFVGSSTNVQISFSGQTGDVATCSSNSAGNLTSCSFNVPQYSETGDQTVTAFDGTNTATSTFLVLRIITLTSTSTITSLSSTTTTLVSYSTTPTTTISTTSATTYATTTLYTTTTSLSVTSTRSTTVVSGSGTTTLSTTTVTVSTTTLLTTSDSLIPTSTSSTTKLSSTPTTTISSIFTTSSPTRTSTSYSLTTKFGETSTASTTITTLYSTFVTTSPVSTVYSTTTTTSPATTLYTTTTSTYATSTEALSSSSTYATATLSTYTSTTYGVSTLYSTSTILSPTTTRSTTSLSTYPTTTVSEILTLYSSSTSTSTTATTTTVASTTTVTYSPTLSISPTAGPTGTVVTLQPSSSGYQPSTTYDYCYETGSGPYTQCAGTYSFQATSAGAIPSSTTFTVTAASSGSIVVSNPETGDVVASAAFTWQAKPPVLDPNSNSYAIATAGSSTSATLSGGNSISTTNQDDVIYACADTYDVGLTLGISDSAHLTWTESVSTTSGTELECWYAVSANALTADTITFTANHDSGGWILYAYAVSGTNTASASTIFDGSPKTAGGTTGNPTTSYTTTQSGDLLIGIAATSHQATLTAGTGFTLISPSVSTASPGSGGGYEYETTSAAGSYTTSFGGSSGTWVLVAVAFAP